MEAGHKAGGVEGAPKIRGGWILALLVVSAVAGVMGVFWLRKNSPILQVERRYQSVVALAQAKGLEPTLLMAVCVSEKAFAGDAARPDERLATELAAALSSAGAPPSDPAKKKRWMHKVLQNLLGSYEAASFAYDLEERHRERWRSLIAGRTGEGG